MFDESRSIMFSGLPEDYDLEEWKKCLEGFGYIQQIFLMSNNTIGYAVYGERESAERAQNELNGSVFRDTQVSVAVCQESEIDLALQLGNPDGGYAAPSIPESAADLYRVTRTLPPLCWLPSNGDRFQ